MALRSAPQVSVPSSTPRRVAPSYYPMHAAPLSLCASSLSLLLALSLRLGSPPAPAPPAAAGPCHPKRRRALATRPWPPLPCHTSGSTPPTPTRLLAGRAPSSARPPHENRREGGNRGRGPGVATGRRASAPHSPTLTSWRPRYFFSLFSLDKLVI
jgi:hypothetical protein